MRSPTSRVGHIEVEGIDLGSAKDDLNRMLTLKAVKAALASSEQTFNNFDNQLLLESFKFSDIASDEAAATAATVLFSTTGPCFLVVLDISAVAAVPPLSTRLPALPILGWLQGNHLDACRKGMMDAGLTGEIPKTPVEEETVDDEEAEEDVGFMSEIKATTKGLWDFAPKISAARVEYIEEEEEEQAVVLGLGGRGRKSEE